MLVAMDEDSLGGSGAGGDEGIYERQAGGCAQSELEGADGDGAVHRNYPRDQASIGERSLPCASRIGAETVYPQRELGDGGTRDKDLGGIVKKYLLDPVGPGLPSIMGEQSRGIEKIGGHVSVLVFSFGDELGYGVALGGQRLSAAQKSTGALCPIGDHTDEYFVGPLPLAPIELPFRPNA